MVGRWAVLVKQKNCSEFGYNLRGKKVKKGKRGSQKGIFAKTQLKHG